MNPGCQTGRDSAGLLITLNRHWSHAAALLLAGVVLALSFCLDSVQDIQTASSTVHSDVLLKAEPESLDFGITWATRDFQWNVALKNDGQKHLEIKGLTTSCGCTSATVAKTRLAPGESTLLHAAMDLTYGNMARTEPLPVAVHVDVKAAPLDNPKQPVSRRFTMRGMVKSLTTIIPASVDLGQHSSLAGRIPSQTVQLRFAEPVTIRARTTNQLITATCVPRERGTAFALHLSFGRFPVGRLSSEVQVEALRKDGTSLSTIAIPISGELVFDVIPTPPTLFLGIGKIGDRVDGIVTLRSLSGSRFEVARATASSATDALLPLVEHEPSGAPSYRVSHVIGKAGFESTSAKFLICHTGTDACEEIDLPIRAVGRLP